MKYTLQLILIGMLAGATVNAEDKPTAPTTAPVPNTSKLVVLKAEYGDLPDGTKDDVTVKVKERALALGAYAGNKRTIISCAKRLKVELIASGHRNFLEVRTLSVDSRRVALLTHLDSPSQQVLFAA